MNFAECGNASSQVLAHLIIHACESVLPRGPNHMEWCEEEDKVRSKNLVCALFGLFVCIFLCSCVVVSLDRYL